MKYIIILNEIKKNMNRYSKKDFFKIKNILKKLGYNKYYEHMHHIMNTMSGKKVIIL